MPEGSKDAAILIATSWQALSRANFENPATEFTDCTVVILFAGFFIEANLNYIIEEMRMTSKMKAFLSKEYPGIQDKLGWFYNEYIARQKAGTRKLLYNQGIKEKIRRKFPGFAKLYRFRNDISHGVINQTANSLQETILLRNQAKKIVDKLFEIAERNFGEIDRVITYQDAIVNK